MTDLTKPTHPGEMLREYVMKPLGLTVTEAAGQVPEAQSLVATHHFLNFIWTPSLFYLKSPRLAFVVIIALLEVIVRLMFVQSRHSHIALYLFIPYSIWVCFATVLNASIWYLN